jgi:L-threonylcarbamoyladenylate synthase
LKRWHVDGDPPDAILDELATIFRGGGVVLLPTDTIYGLHAMAADQDAIARIRAMKGRDDGKPFLIIASSPDQLAALGATIPEPLRDIWPAPLTAILALNAKSVAARIPDLGWLRALLGRTGPLVSTSANRSGDVPLTSPEMLSDDLLSGIDGVLDQGPREGKPSTIVDFTGPTPRFVREGDKRFSQFLRKRLWKEL